jgi:hypothetical protein
VCCWHLLNPLLAAGALPLAQGKCKELAVAAAAVAQHSRVTHGACNTQTCRESCSRTPHVGRCPSAGDGTAHTQQPSSSAGSAAVARRARCERLQRVDPGQRALATGGSRASVLSAVLLRRRRQLCVVAPTRLLLANRCSPSACPGTLLRRNGTPAGTSAWPSLLGERLRNTDAAG